MKKITRFFSAAAAAALALTAAASSMAVFASDSDINLMAVPQPSGHYDGSITLASSDAKNSSIGGRTFRLYRIFNAAVGGERNIAYQIYDDAVRQAIVDTFHEGEDVGDYFDTVLINDVKDSEEDPEALQQLAKNLLKAVQGAENTTTEYKDVTVPPGSDEVVVDNLKYGYYLIEDMTEANNRTVVAALALTTTKPTATVKVKLTQPTVNKYFDDDRSDWNDDTQRPNSKSIGDTVNYKIVAVVPETTGYKTYRYSIVDILSPGLTLSGAEPVVEIYSPDKVKRNDVTVTKGTDYSYSSNNLGDDGTRISFTFTNIKAEKFRANDLIVITYTATVNENAVIGGAGNPNSVMLQYSNNPSVDNSVAETPQQIIKTYVFNLEITKIVAGASDYLLAGAEFKISREKSPSGTEYAVIDASGKVTRWTDNEGEASTIVTGRDGKAKVVGLGAGTYSLTETKAPAGYNKLDRPISITITPTYNDTGSLTDLKATVNGSEVTSADKKTVPVTVENAGGPPLPETGGMGTTLIYVIGAALAVGAAVLLVARRRMRSGDM